MRTPEQILREYFKFDDVNGSKTIKCLPLTLTDLIEETQTEAWNEAIEIAAENAETKEIGDKYGHWLADVIDEDSILRLKK